MTKTTYEYPDADGRVRFKVVRTDNADGTKRFAQFHRDNPDGEWEAKAPSWLRPLWRLPDLDMLPDGSAVLVVEGEKAAIAAQALLGNRITVTTWAGGANAVKKTDWSPIKRHRVACWPDLDQKCFPSDHARAGHLMPFMMQPGTQAMMQVITMTGGALVNIPDNFIEDASWVVPSGWDLADLLPEAYTLADVAQYIREALDAAMPSRALAAPSIATTNAQNDCEQAVDQRQTREIVPANDDEVFPLVPLLTSANGTVRPCYENALRLLEAQTRWPLRYDMFANRPTVNGEQLKDEHILMISREVQSRGIIASTAIIAEAVVGAALMRRFHPVQDYLDGLAWDGVNRLEMWLIDHAGADDSPYVRAVSQRWLIQAVARIRDPGCQADATLILEGDQGIRKSTLLKVLFGDRWFTDHLPDLSQKDALLQLLGVWCVEVAEMATFNRSEAAKIKAFLTSRTDRYRPPYGKGAEEFPRGCVFAGTVNPGAGGYFKDPTGSRRFWPVRCNGQIDTDAVAQLRDQLWAEADARYKRKEPWHLNDDKLVRAAQEEQELRREEDAWEDKVATYLLGKTRTTVGSVLEEALGMYKVQDWTLADQQRAGRILTALRWERKQVRDGTLRRWVYTSPNVLPLSKGEE